MRRASANTYWSLFVAVLIVSFISTLSYGQEQVHSARYSKLSVKEILNKSSAINFFEPPREIVVDYKLLDSDFQLYNGMVTFRLDGAQKRIILQCGLSDYGPKQASNTLRVIGDGRELLSQGYRTGDNVGVDIDIQGVHALTFELSGTTSGYFYCSDQITY